MLFCVAHGKFHRFVGKFYEVIIFILHNLPYTITIKRNSQRTIQSRETGSPAALRTRKGSQKIMNTIIRTNQGVQEISVEAWARSLRRCFLFGEVTDDMAMAFAKEIARFQAEDPSEPAKVFINSPGGSVGAGMLIYDIIQTAGVPIEMYCLGKAYSMGAIIFACGKNGRYMLPHSKVMIHEPLIQSGIGGKTSSVQTLANDMLRTKASLAEVLQKHTGQSAEKLEEVMKNDTFFTAQEAVDFGLADGVKGFDEMMNGGEA